MTAVVLPVVPDPILHPSAEGPSGPPALGLLDPKNDFVFKTMLTRRVVLLHHMLEGVLGRPIRTVQVVDPSIPREQILDKEIVLDVRAVLDDGSRALVEMQVRLNPALPGRFTYYLARDFVNQLRHGQGYERLTPSVVIVWLPRPLLPELEDLHSIFELRERRRDIVLGQYLSVHVIQLSALSTSKVTGYDVVVERWGRFFMSYKDPAVLAQLAAEDPIMAVATQTLEEASQDRELRRLALEREDERALYRIELAACREEGRATLLLDQLGALFGPPSAATVARVRAGTAEDLYAWGLRVLGAKSLEDVFGPRRAGMPT